MTRNQIPSGITGATTTNYEDGVLHPGASDLVDKNEFGRRISLSGSSHLHLFRFWTDKESQEMQM